MRLPRAPFRLSLLVNLALLAMRVGFLDGHVSPGHRVNPLSRRTVARRNEFMDAHLQSDISLRDLAAVASLRLPHKPAKVCSGSPTTT
ncbi:hypothetical protein EV130_101477 [Rhizobium azibense]|uniref:Uncharacterized protein n=1 Tax=Rhizobium azibense TaxID=1136135 RepID=A0A4R3S1H5_9HYPH|nr:hypothetical protein EV130_101477 [Rhizobium azibense]TCU41079.1 hypothetical protein EV129_101366 [Rhizobium azibense]